MRRFFTTIVPFHLLRPAPGLIATGDYGYGRKPLAMRTDDGTTIVVYVPAGGSAALALPADRPYGARWFDPRSGGLLAAALSGDTGRTEIEAPGGVDEQGHPWDWVLVLQDEAGNATPV